MKASRTDLAPWIDDKTQLVLADTWISSPTTLKIGGWVFELDHVGPAHTPENLTVFASEEKLLFAGDLFFNGRLPFVGQANSSQWIKSLDQMLAQDAQVVVPGHGSASTTPKKEIVMTRDYLKYLRTTVGQAVQDLVSLKEACKSTDWTAFEAAPMFNFCQPHERLQHPPTDGRRGVRAEALKAESAEFQPAALHNYYYKNSTLRSP